MTVDLQQLNRLLSNIGKFFSTRLVDNHSTSKNVNRNKIAN